MILDETEPNPNEFGIIYEVDDLDVAFISSISQQIQSQLGLQEEQKDPNYRISKPHLSLIQISTSNIFDLERQIQQEGLPSSITVRLQKVVYMPGSRNLWLILENSGLQDIHETVLDLCRRENCEPIRQYRDRAEKGEFDDNLLANFGPSYGSKFADSAHITLFKLTEGTELRPTDLDSVNEKLQKDCISITLIGPKICQINYYGSLIECA